MKDFVPEDRDINTPLTQILDIQQLYDASRLKDSLPKSLPALERQLFQVQNIARVHPYFMARLLEDY